MLKVFALSRHCVEFNLVEGMVGSVENVVTTGDNDEPIFPVQYYNYYIYCDKCGSFKLRYWLEPKNHAEIEQKIGRVKGVRNGAAAASAVSAVLAFFGGFVCLGVSLVVLIGAVVWASYLDSKIEMRGVRCEECETEYAYGSPFFTNFKENPRNYSMEDAPKPLYTVYQIKGEEIGPA